MHDLLLVPLVVRQPTIMHYFALHSNLEYIRHGSDLGCRAEDTTEDAPYKRERDRGCVVRLL